MAASLQLRFLYRILRQSKRKCSLRTFSRATAMKQKQQADDRTTHFGYQTVTEEEKEKKVYEVFKNVAEDYDLMNDAMSMGIHRLWKDHFIKRLGPLPGTQLIDVAGGTGDIAFRFLNYVKSLNQSRTAASGSQYDIEIPSSVKASVFMDPTEETSSSSSDSGDSESSSSDSEESGLLGNTAASCHVTVCDINQSMLEVGKTRAAEAGITSGISWLQGNAEHLPVPSNKYDAYTIAFGIRNCTHVDKVVEDAYRVLKPGGRFMCLEFSQVSNPVFRMLYDEYSFQVIPAIGQVVAGDWKSYQYLVESIRQFPDQEDFKHLIQSAGFKAVTYENLTMGVVAIHSGFKL